MPSLFSPDRGAVRAATQDAALQLGWLLKFAKILSPRVHRLTEKMGYFVVRLIVQLLVGETDIARITNISITPLPIAYVI